MEGPEVVARAAEEDQADQALNAVKAESTTGDHTDLAVDSLRATVVEPGSDVGKDAGLESAQGPCQLLERMESRAHGPAKPFIELLRSDAVLVAIEDVEE